MMTRTCQIFLVALASLVAPHAAHARADGASTGAKIALSSLRKAAIPPWARKYNMNCSGCHYPTVPRLNATGLAFKWAGYRMPDEIGKAAEVKKIDEYLGARGIGQYQYTKTKSTPADTNTLLVPSASVFLGGALGKYYGAFLEFERMPDASIDLVGMFTGAWGKENAFGGVRAGQGHLLFGGAAAGFDRPTGILAPLPLEAQLTPGIPFTFAGDVAGVEAFYVLNKMNRVAVQYVNGLAPGGEGMDVVTTPNTHNWVVSDQVFLDDIGLGLMGVAYFGRIDGLDSTQATLRSSYQRYGLTGNKFFGPFEAQAGYVYGNNSDLPIGTAKVAFPSSTVSSDGYWFYGGYTMKPSYWTVYGRYEVLDPIRSVADQQLRRFVIGSVLPINVPEYLRLGFEYFFDSPQSSSTPSRQGIAAQIHIAF
jgi:hypothetical protein